MEIIIDFDNISDPKVIIYSETANQILIKCFEQAEMIRAEELRKKKPALAIKNTSSKYVLLASIMDLVVFKNPITSRFLRNKSDEIRQNLSNGGKYGTTGFDHHHLLTLSRFAGIDDYDVFNQQYAPQTEIKVYYSTHKFNWYNFIRVPNNGVLTETGSFWILKDLEIGKEIKREVKDVCIFQMPADAQPIWFKVITEKSETFYFSTDLLKPVRKEDPLFRFFHSFKQ